MPPGHGQEPHPPQPDQDEAPIGGLDRCIRVLTSWRCSRWVRTSAPRPNSRTCRSAGRAAPSCRRCPTPSTSAVGPARMTCCSRHRPRSGRPYALSSGFGAQPARTGRGRSLPEPVRRAAGGCSPLALAAVLALVVGIGLGFGADRLMQPRETVIGRADLERRCPAGRTPPARRSSSATARGTGPWSSRSSRRGRPPRHARSG